MNPVHDTISELEAVTAEMAEMQDLAGTRLSELLEKRGALIRRLIASKFDASDSRIVSIIANAADLQQRLQRRADSVREDLSMLDATQVLLNAVSSTLDAPQPKGVDLSA